MLLTVVVWCLEVVQHAPSDGRCTFVVGGWVDVNVYMRAPDVGWKLGVGMTRPATGLLFV